MEDEKVRLLDRQFSRFLAKYSLLSGAENNIFRELVWPISAREVDLVQRSGLSGDGQQPLRVFSDLLYLQRFFQYEKQLAVRICEMVVESVVLSADGSFVDSLFAGQEKEDLQRVAAEQALQKNFLIISGGPGTGKTTTVVNFVSAWQRPQERPQCVYRNPLQAVSIIYLLQKKKKRICPRRHLLYIVYLA